MAYALSLVTAATTDPITLEEVKEALRSANQSTWEPMLELVVEGFAQLSTSPGLVHSSDAKLEVEVKAVQLTSMADGGKKHRYGEHGYSYTGWPGEHERTYTGKDDEDLDWGVLLPDTPEARSLLNALVADVRRLAKRLAAKLVPGEPVQQALAVIRQAVKDKQSPLLALIAAGEAAVTKKRKAKKS